MDQKRTNKEKRAKVISELKTYPEESNSSIAERVKVSRSFVGRVRKELEQIQEIEKITTRINRVGNSIDTSKLKKATKSRKVTKDSVNIYTVIKGHIAELSSEEVLFFNKQVDNLIKEELEHRKERSLEKAILKLSSLGNQATSSNDQGFKKSDVGFGEYLANKIQNKIELTKFEARQAHQLLEEYSEQIEDFPLWGAIQHQYRDKERYYQLSQLSERNDRQIIVNGDKIIVSFKYSEHLVKLVKTIEPRPKFNGKNKVWECEKETSLQVLETFKYENFEIDANIYGLIELEKKVQLEIEEKALLNAKKTLALIESSEIDQPLSNGWKLLEHQKEGVKWLLSHTQNGVFKGGILADHMGLGKTIQSLVSAQILSKRNDNCPIFIICPASLKEHWKKEASKVNVNVIISSWTKIGIPLSNHKYILIADEAHYAQNLKSKRTQKLLDFCNHDNCIACWLLTGTPLKNGLPVNLFPLLLACKHPLAKDKMEFEKKYCQGHFDAFGWNNKGASNLEDLSEKTEDVIFRRTKDQCLDLPSKIRTINSVFLNNVLEQQYEEEINSRIADYHKRVKEGKVQGNAEALVVLNALRKVGSKYKVESTLEIAKELLEQDQQVVIFTEFVDSARTLSKELNGVLLHGSTRQEDRQKIIDQFQSGQSKVFVGTIQAGGVGITLTKSSHVILHDRPWTSAETEQAEDRCHRIGQKSCVNVYWQQLGYIDQAIDSLIEKKQTRIDLILKGKRKTLNKIKSSTDLAKQLLNLSFE